MSLARFVPIVALFVWGAAIVPACSSSDETCNPEDPACSGANQTCIQPEDPREPNSCISWAGERLCSCAREQRFVVEADTVKDKTTGLTWQKRDSSLEGVVADNTNGGRVTWAEAAGYCAKLTVAGGGWRLPTVDEAKVLVDEEDDRYRCFAPCAFSAACSDYWTSTKAPGDNAYRVSQYFGSDEAADLTEEINVRCVR